jgi:O-antigen ligase
VTVERVALRALQAGLIAIVLVVVGLFPFELDRFFVPKELVLHLTAVVAGGLLVRRMTLTRVDKLLCLYLLLCGISALFATNRWLGLRALAITSSALLIFQAARIVGRPALNAVALAVVVTAVAALIQTYGIHTIFFSEERAPGGTLGNRNFVGHVAAFGLPIVLLAAIRAQTRRAYLLAAGGAALVAAALILTRSRAAWLASAVMGVVLLVALLAAPLVRANRRVWARLTGIGVMALLVIGAVLLLPNDLHWNSRNPYLDSVKGVTGYDTGSGRGRLTQYGQSLLMTLRHPLLGVGPGNWAVEYPGRVPRNDPSLDQSRPGRTSNPWPSSDWMAFLSERGPAATSLLALAFLAIVATAWRQLRNTLDPDQALGSAILLATLAAAGVTGLFDAVLLLALPAMLVWTSIGALSPPLDPPETIRPLPASLALAVIALSAWGAWRSTSQLRAMDIYSSSGSLARAAQIDPGNDRVQLRLATRGSRKERCVHALAAHALYPHDSAAASLARGCGGKR